MDAFRSNMGRFPGIDVTPFASGDLYTIVTNKIPKRLCRLVKGVTLDRATSMDATDKNISTQIDTTFIEVYTIIILFTDSMLI